MSAEMSLVCLTMSNALEKSIAMVNVRSRSKGWLNIGAISYAAARDEGEQKCWSVCDKSHVGWGK